jgi:hypothetical protein
MRSMTVGPPRRPRRDRRGCSVRTQPRPVRAGLHTYYAEEVRIPFILLLLLVLAGCSSAPDTKQAKPSGPPEPPGAATPVGKHPLAKYIELVGFRLTEASPGKLNIRFAVVNHSEADIGDLALKVKLTTTAAKPGDEPVTEFEAKVPSVGPQEIKDVKVSATTKLRIYELPDWQFLKAEFEITSPAP